MNIFLDTLLATLRHPATWVVAILAGIGIAAYNFVDEAKDTEAKLTVVEKQYEAKVREVESLQREREAQALAMEALSKRNKQITEERNRAIKQLERFKDREDVVRAKPALVERRANAATDRLFYQIACSTGSEADCKRSEANAGKRPRD